MFYAILSRRESMMPFGIYITSSTALFSIQAFNILVVQLI